jgi:predicted dehydrogenase
MRVVVVGYGPRGQTWVETARRAGLSDVLVVETDRAVSEHAATAGLSTSGSLESSVAADDIVVVATPPASHVDLARRCAALGASVIVEKPLAMSTEAALALVEDVRAAGTRMTVVHNFRLRSLESAINAGLERVGPPRSAIVATSRPRSGVPAHESELPHPPLWDYALHELDLLVGRFGGLPRGVMAYRREMGVDRLASYSVHLDWGDGRVAEYLLMEDPRLYSQYTWLAADDGAVRAVDGSVEVVSRTRRPRPIKVRRSARPERRILDAVASGDPLPGLSPEDGARAVALVEAVVRSVDAGAPVVLEEVFP